MRERSQLLGSVRDLKDFGAGIGFNTAAKKENQDDVMKGRIQNALKKAFAPEFLNRLDDVIMFNSLEKSHIHQIIDAANADFCQKLF